MIFKAAKKDGMQIVDIIKRIDIFGQGEVDSVQEAWEEYIAYGSVPDGYHFFVYREGDKVVGFTCYGIRYLTEGVYDLLWIAVDPDARQKGVGRALMSATEQAVREMGGRMLIAETSGISTYENTRKFYDKVGYINEASIKDFYKLSDDLKIYTKRL